MTRAQNIISSLLKAGLLNDCVTQYNKVIPIDERVNEQPKPAPAPFTHEILQMLYPYLDFEDFRKLRKVDTNLYQLSTGIYEDKKISGKIALICAIYDLCYTYAVEKKCEVALTFKDYKIRFRYYSSTGSGTYDETGKIVLFREDEIIFSPYYLQRIFKKGERPPGVVLLPMRVNNYRSYVTDILYINNEIKLNPFNQVFDVRDYSAAHFQNVNELNEDAQNEIKKAYIIRRVGDMMILLLEKLPESVDKTQNISMILDNLIQPLNVKIEEDTNVMMRNQTSLQTTLRDFYTVKKPFLEFLKILKRWGCSSASVFPHSNITEMLSNLTSSTRFSTTLTENEFTCFNKCYISIRKAYIKCGIEQYIANVNQENREQQNQQNVPSPRPIDLLPENLIRAHIRDMIPMNGEQLQRLREINYENTKEEDILRGIYLLTEKIIRISIVENNNANSAAEANNANSGAEANNAKTHLIYECLLDFIVTNNNIKLLGMNYIQQGFFLSDEQKEGLAKYMTERESKLDQLLEKFVNFFNQSEKKKHKDYELIIQNYTPATSAANGGKPLQKRRKSQKASGPDRQHAKKKSRSKRA